MANLKAILIDLDDTLVPEMEPEREALLVVCGLVSDRYGVYPEAMLKTIDESCHRLWAQWKTPAIYSEIAYSAWEGLWGPSDESRHGLGNDEETILKYKRDAWDEVLSVYGVEDVGLRDQIIERHRSERVKRLRPFPEAVGVIEELRANFQLAVVTNGSPAVQRFKLEQAGLSGYFPVVVASGDVGIGKPDPLPFTTALDQLGVAPKEAMVIGNSWSSDIQGAANLGMRSIWFNLDNDERPDNGTPPTFEISSLSEIPDVIRQMAG